jgi:hypothetical protein
VKQKITAFVVILVLSAAFIGFLAVITGPEVRRVLDDVNPKSVLDDSKTNISYAAIAGVIVLVFGIVAIIVGLDNYRLIRRREWATTEGRVTSVESSVSLGEVEPQGVYVVLYRYFVDGVELQSKYDASHESQSEREIVDLLYPINHRVIVNYDPANPSVSWLEEHEHKDARRSLMIGVLLFAMAIMIFAFDAFW